HVQVSVLERFLVRRRRGELLSRFLLCLLGIALGGGFLFDTILAVLGIFSLGAIGLGIVLGLCSFGFIGLLGHRFLGLGLLCLGLVLFLAERCSANQEDGKAYKQHQDAKRGHEGHSVWQHAMNRTSCDNKPSRRLSGANFVSNV